ncbi:BZIP domain-containing protein [Madurella fahalii]|uniref:BZIP domain-containing protein n=1 Tax=Madurella fahalii TaxID=1157608 RepID=A0ABQ0GP42_9PEZI
MNALRHKRTHLKLLQSRDDPPEPTPVDTEIARHQGSSVAIEATPERLQASKNLPTPSLSQIIEQRTWENGRLRQELAYQQRRNGASMYLLEEVKNAVDSLQQALVNFQKLSKELGEDEGEATPGIPPRHTR